MKPNSSSDGFVRRVRLSVAWYALKEYVNGALWVLPSVAGLAALLAGSAMSQVTVAPGSNLDRLAFQGTADDARALLITVSSTVVTVIALVLGLTVVALQLSSTQFSPRLLRNFLRDRGTQDWTSRRSALDATSHLTVSPASWTDFAQRNADLAAELVSGAETTTRGE
jgi:uncharacterized membrane protein